MPANGGSPTSKTGQSNSPTHHGALNSRDALTVKAAKKVREGLPWPEDAPVAHDARLLASNSNVPWHTDKVRETVYVRKVPMM